MQEKYLPDNSCQELRRNLGHNLAGSLKRQEDWAESNKALYLAEVVWAWIDSNAVNESDQNEQIRSFQSSFGKRYSDDGVKHGDEFMAFLRDMVNKHDQVMDILDKLIPNFDREASSTRVADLIAEASSIS